MGMRKIIRQLEKDLAAEIEMGEKEEEIWVVDGYHDEWAEVWAANRGTGYEWKGRVEDGHYETHKVPVYAPDTEKREVARVELKRIYDNSGWYQFMLRRRIRGALNILARGK